jgi:hypothetical protein
VLAPIVTKRREEAAVKYGLAWLVGVPIPLILLWFIANQMGCGV